MRILTKLKICGLRRAEDISYVNEYRPDYVGFVFAKGSKRRVTEDVAGGLKEKLSPDILAVGVFVNEDIDMITSLCEKGIIDVIQLHGDEDNGYIENLRKNLPKITIIKAIRVLCKEDVIKGNEYLADYLLFDTFSGKEQGGTGESFDWKLLNGINKPFFLAGGINESNVRDALKNVKPYGIDVSSGVETDGFKDRNKIRRIIDKIRLG